MNKNSETKSLFAATVVNFLDPSPYIGWSLVMGPLLLKGWRESPANGISLLVIFYVWNARRLSGNNDNYFRIAEKITGLC